MYIYIYIYICLLNYPVNSRAIPALFQRRALVSVQCELYMFKDVYLVKSRVSPRARKVKPG